MTEGIPKLPEGHYRTPAIGPESLVQAAETLLHVDDQGVIEVTSPLYDRPYSIGDGKTFKDPRADTFLQTVTWHQFHHFTTRQLSLVEDFETRPGSSRFVRLGGLLDSAKMLNDLGATFEQIVQTVISDLAHPAGSHLRGDYMVGDYINQDSHDSDLWENIKKSGLLEALMLVGVVDDDGRLAGSPVLLQDLADPRTPRRHDIVECPRPDGNVDRNQFTLHEGVIIYDSATVREARDAIVRVETGDGERMAMNSAEAARLLYILAVRHQSENWAEPMHRLVEEMVLLPDRYAFCVDPSLAWAMSEHYPVDYARTDEQTWYDTIQSIAQLDPLVSSALRIARLIAGHQREQALGYTTDTAYAGPVDFPGVSIRQGSKRRKSTLSIQGDELWIALPEPKYRGPIDSLVVTRTGLKRITQIDPSLSTYAEQRKQWAIPLLAKVALPSAVAREIRTGIRRVDRHWSNSQTTRAYQNPALRPPMPAEALRAQVDAARERVIREARQDS